MSQPSDELLAAYLCRTLEPGRVLEIDERLRASADLRARLALVTARLAQEDAPSTSWFVPPAGHQRGVGAPEARVQLALHLGDGGLQPGDLFEVEVGPVADAEALAVVILYRGAGGWQVVFPEVAEEWTPLAEVPVQVDGARVLPLVARADPGHQAWAVALVPVDLAVDWSVEAEARWEPVRIGVRSGEIPVVTVEVVVSGVG